MVVHVAVDAAGNLGSLGTEGRTTSLEENYQYNASNAGVGVRGEPAVARSLVRAGSSLAQDFFFVEVETQAARGAEANRSRHTVRKFRDDRSDIKLALDPGLEIGNVFRLAGMLQVIESASVGDGGNHCAKLQRSH